MLQIKLTYAIKIVLRSKFIFMNFYSLRTIKVLIAQWTLKASYQSKANKYLNRNWLIKGRKILELVIDYAQLEDDEVFLLLLNKKFASSWKHLEHKYKKIANLQPEFLLEKKLYLVENIN